MISQKIRLVNLKKKRRRNFTRKILSSKANRETEMNLTLRHNGAFQYKWDIHTPKFILKRFPLKHAHAYVHQIYINNGI